MEGGIMTEREKVERELVDAREALSMAEQKITEAIETASRQRIVVSKLEEKLYSMRQELPRPRD